jgi:hypothetical protein
MDVRSISVMLLVMRLELRYLFKVILTSTQSSLG